MVKGSPLGPARLALGLLIGLLLAPAPGRGDQRRRSDPRQLAEARHLLQRGEALLSIGRAIEGRSLLRRALSLAERAGAPGRGYARYAHFRLARQLARDGQRKQALAALKRALAIKVEAGQVEPRYRVTRDHRFIVEHFPRLAGLVPERHPESRVVPSAAQLIGRGRRVFAVSQRAVRRLDRQDRGLTLVHRLPLGGRRGDDRLLAVAASSDARRLAVVQRVAGQHQLISIDLTTGAEQSEPLPGPPARLAMDDRGAALVLFARKRLELLRVAPTKRARSAKRRPRPLLLSARGVPLAFTHRGLLLLTADRQGRPKQVVLHELPSRRKRVIYRFRQADRAARAQALVSPSGARIALFIEDPGRRRTQHLLVFELAAAGRRYAHAHDLKLAIGGAKAPRLARVVAFEGKGERSLLAALGRGERLEVYRFDYRKGFAARIARLDRRGAVRGLGASPDGSVWLHQGNALVLINAKRGAPRRIDLASRVKLRGLRWRGASQRLEAPAQWIFGLRRPGAAGPGPYALINAKDLAGGR